MKYKLNNDYIEFIIDELFDLHTVRDVFDYFVLSKKTIHLLHQNKDYTVNHCYSNDQTILHKGDILSIKAFDSHIDFICQDHPLDIVYEDDFLLIVNKDAKTIIHPEGKDGINTLCNYVARYYQKHHLDYPVRYIHRLDKETTGLVLFCKCALLQAYFDQELALKHIKRSYHAIIKGSLPERVMTVEKPIGRNRHKQSQMIVSSSGKYAKTTFTTLIKKDSYSLLDCQLDTGRKHQIRVHLSYLKHPILSDPLYGYKDCHIKRLALHGYQLEFFHPILQVKKIIKIDNPQDFSFIIS